MKKSIVKSYFPYLWILFLGAVVYYGIEFRWLLRDFISADTSNYKIPWLEHLQQTGLQNALVKSVTNYSPMFTYLMASFNTLIPDTESHYLIKLITNITRFNFNQEDY